METGLFRTVIQCVGSNANFEGLPSWVMRFFPITTVSDSNVQINRVPYGYALNKGCNESHALMAAMAAICSAIVQ